MVKWVEWVGWVKCDGRVDEWVGRVEGQMGRFNDRFCSI
jgi:hypothetical protein